MHTLLLSVLVAGALGHNWMVSPSRVPFAATVYPCMGSRTIYPHIQIAVGQEFQMEWATGHDRLVYFVLLAKNDSVFLTQDTTRNMDAYITEAPQQLFGPAYQKFHRTARWGNATHALGGTVASHYDRQILPGDPLYRARPAQFGSSRFQWTYVDSPNDRYVSYRSATKPWIRALWRYEIQEGDAGEWDFSIFNMPAGTPPGDYVIHYLWSGYYDCIDINVLAADVVPGPVPYPYGKPVNGTGSLKSNRVDHCVFDRPNSYVTIPRFVLGGYKDAAKSCTDNCIAAYEVGGCSGVSVFPLSLITKNWGPHWNVNNNILKTLYEQGWNVSGHFRDGLFDIDNGIPNDVLNSVNATYSNYSGIWRIMRDTTSGSQSYVGVNQATLNTIRSWIEAQTDPWVCIMVAPRFPTTTDDKYTLVDDPLDPVWSSTCYEILEQVEFIGFNTTLQSFSPTIASRYIGSNCISCADSIAWRMEAYTPRWTTTSCRLCERDDPNPNPGYPFIAPLQIRSAMAIETSLTAGPNGDSTCVLPPQFNITKTAAGAGTDWNNYCIQKFTYTSPYFSGNAVVGGVRLGWMPSRITESIRISPEVCAAYVNTYQSSLCTSIVSWRSDSSTDGCKCLRNVACCTKYLKVADTTGKEQLFESKPVVNDPLLDPTCSRNVTGLRSAGNPKVCCKVPQTNRNACGTPGCALTTGGNTAVNAFCRGYLIPPTRLCTQFAPPCIVP